MILNLNSLSGVKYTLEVLLLEHCIQRSKSPAHPIPLLCLRKVRRPRVDIAWEYITEPTLLDGIYHMSII